jgi:hypothetical protein
MSGLSKKKSWRSISLNCAIRGKQRTTGGGPREILKYVSLIASSYIAMYLVSIQKWTYCTIPKTGR